jgi:hypothetical protein
LGIRKKHTQDDLDQESTIADMNIDGMPWKPGSYKDRVKRQMPYSEQPQRTNSNDPFQPVMSKRETLSLMLNSMVTALVIGLIFMGGFFLFIIFCVYVWFR